MGSERNAGGAGGSGGPPTVQIKVQTPRGLWNMDEPKEAALRPDYAISTKIEQVVTDVRQVFKFVENDSKYTLFFGKEELEPQRTLASYQIKTGTLLVLSVQGERVTVPAVVTVEQVREELAAVADYAAAAGLALGASTLSESHPVFYVTFHNRDNVEFFAEFNCHEYPLHPPTIEFADAERKRRGTQDVYPSCFHGMPCICARYNRKAYKAVGGPHEDWRLIDWQLPTQAGPRIDSLAMIVSDLHSKIAASRGRMA